MRTKTSKITVKASTASKNNVKKAQLALAEKRKIKKLNDIGKIQELNLDESESENEEKEQSEQEEEDRDEQDEDEEQEDHEDKNMNELFLKFVKKYKNMELSPKHKKPEQVKPNTHVEEKTEPPKKVEQQDKKKISMLKF